MSYRSTAMRRAETCDSPVADPVAIVGMAARLPAAPDLSAFWDLLVRGGDAIAEGVPDRLSTADWAAVRKAVGAPDATRLGGFLDRIDEFDAAFFGNSPREAVRMSPVHRVLMEIVWESIEDSGTTAEALAGSRTSVFTSCQFTPEYWDLLVDNGLHDLHGLIGTLMHGTVAGRVAHTFDLRGPAMNVDATCASSLLAVHLACRSIRSGESDMAIVSSVNLQLEALYTAVLAGGRIISPTGACRFGDTSADGYVRSDGALSVVLKPLSDAIADGDRIYASILGSGASGAGAGPSLAAPSRTGQAYAIRAAHADAGVTPSEISYVEAHGTGTTEGDRIELTALGDVLGDVSGTCLVGSAKSNVGHTEVAAGLVGLVKTALALRHRTIPPTLHVQEPNAVFADVPLCPVDTVRPWPARDGRRVAGVSSFGLSGTNVHLVVAEAPTPQSLPSVDERATFVLPVSARAATAVRDLARAYADRVMEAPEELGDICYSAGVRRTHHQYRMAVVASSGREMAARLGEYAWGGRPSTVIASDRKVFGPPRVVFVFPGQSGHWPGMGRRLLGTSKAFRDALRECDQVVPGVMARIESGAVLRRVDEIQPVLWAVQVALAAVWRSGGIEPDLVIGHSMGEVAAATVTGALTVRQAAAVICRRSELVAKIRRPGAMVAVQLSEDEVRAAIGDLADQVTVAVVNSSSSTVIAGDPDALASVVRPLRDRGVFCRDLHTHFASHTPDVEQLRPELLAALEDVRPRRARTPMWSTALNCALDGPELTARYWMANLREPVRFADAMRSVLADGERTLFVEISPHPVLESAMDDAVAGTDSAIVTSLRREEPEEQSLALGLASAYVQGCTVDWASLNPGGRFVSLPSYPWQRKRFWVPTQRSREVPEPVEPAVQVRPSDADVQRRFVEAVADLLTMLPEDVDPMVPLPFLGMDSMLATRLNSRLKHDLGVELPLRDLLGTRTVAEIAHDIGRARSAA